jgi:hypothetical protein
MASNPIGCQPSRSTFAQILAEIKKPIEKLSLSALQTSGAFKTSAYTTNARMGYYRPRIGRPYSISAPIGPPYTEDPLAELLLKSTTEKISRHVVFIHGLKRVGHAPWMSSGTPEEFWPLWLSKDIAELVIWSIEYDAAPTL